MAATRDTSALTLNRLSLYLRALRLLQQAGVATVSSGQLAKRLHLSAPLIRKDLAQFGEFGTRGVGYNIERLIPRLVEILGLDQERTLVIVGMGNLGSALAGYLGFNTDAFRVSAIFDNDPKKIGRGHGGLTILPPREIARVVAQDQVDLGVLTVPVEAAQENYDLMVEAGILAILNFAPVSLREHDAVRTKNVDLRIHLEELTYFLAGTSA